MCNRWDLFAGLALFVFSFRFSSLCRAIPGGFLLIAKPVENIAQRRLDGFQAVFVGVCTPGKDAPMMLSANHAVLPDVV
jgi:hypothetical protein